MNLLKWKKFIVCSDTHGSEVDKAALSKFLEFNKQFKADIRVHAGDLFDFRGMRLKASEEEKSESMEEDFQAGIKLLEDYRPTYYLKGNHSLHKDTELLTENGWVNVQHVRGLKVAQFDKDRKITFAEPLDYISYHADKLHVIKGGYTYHAVTDGHDIVYDGVKTQAINFTEGLASGFWNSGFRDKYATPDSDDWIRLITWVVMDGTVVDHSKYAKSGKSNKIRVQFKLSYEHKIHALRELLDRMGIKYTFAKATMSGVNKLQPYYIRIYGDHGRAIWNYLGKVKLLPKIWAKYPPESLRVFLDELKKTDGHISGATINWVTIEKHNCEVVQEWCLFCGINSKWVLRPSSASGFANGKPQYTTSIQDRQRLVDCTFARTTVEDYNDTVYCVTMPLGTIICRHNGCITFSGNCDRLDRLAQSNNGMIRDAAQSGLRVINQVCKNNKIKVLPYHKRDGVLKIGHLKILHGFYCGLMAAKQHALVYGSCLFGHVHTSEEYAIPRMERTVARSIGCLCRLDMQYNKSMPSSLRHTHGFAYGAFNPKSGAYFPIQAECVDGTWFTPSL